MGDKYYKQYLKRKKIKRSPIYRVGLIIFGILLVIFGFLSQRPFDDGKQYSSAQNDQGFYFYTTVEEGSYYASLNGLEGDALFQQMRILLHTNFSPTSYAEAKEFLAQSDLSLTDPTKVYNIYDGVLVNATWDSTSWHREHVWPNSRLGVDRVVESERSIASDLHNLRAITPAVNSRRGDRFFSDGKGEAQITEDGGFYPGDDHRGDVARILFYMFVMYEGLTLRDEDLDELDTYEPEGAVMGILSVLLKWHKEDPVSDFERARNQVIYEKQNNRNPFIDKPEYAHLIFENMTILDLLMDDENNLEGMIKESEAILYG